jgi:hypothetical protein
LLQCRGPVGARTASSPRRSDESAYQGKPDAQLLQANPIDTGGHLGSDALDGRRAGKLVERVVDACSWPITKLAMGDNNREHTIYRIPVEWVTVTGKRKKPKCGCTIDLKHRSWEYRTAGYDGSIEVLEIVTGTACQAGDREHHWADHYGYPRGQRYDTQNWSKKVPKEILRACGKNMNSKLTKEQRSKIGRIGGKAGTGGKVAGQKNVESGHWARVQSKVNAQRDQCLTHGIICAPGPMGSHRKFHSGCVIVRVS